MLTLMIRFLLFIKSPSLWLTLHLFCLCFSMYVPFDAIVSIIRVVIRCCSCCYFCLLIVTRHLTFKCLLYISLLMRSPFWRDACLFGALRRGLRKHVVGPQSSGEWGQPLHEKWHRNSLLHLKCLSHPLVSSAWAHHTLRPLWVKSSSISAVICCHADQLHHHWKLMHAWETCSQSSYCWSDILGSSFESVALLPPWARWTSSK